MKPIGGYFELELSEGQEYHKNALRLNTGRNAFEYLLRANDYSKVLLPEYTCDVMLEAIKKTGIRCEFYKIDKNLYPILDFSELRKKDVVVYNNYFGLYDDNVNKIAGQKINLIIDNSQAFYSMPLNNIDTFYSARKFFGIPDGAYLYTNRMLGNGFEQDISCNRFKHLLGRIDFNAGQFYDSFKNNEKSLSGQEIKFMSNLTQRQLEGINYKLIAKKRRHNFRILHRSLCKANLLKFKLSLESVPLVYPYLIKNGLEVKRKLIEKMIFTPTYWPNVLDAVNNETWEYFITENLVPLPIDQRYGEPEMQYILQCIEDIS